MKLFVDDIRECPAGWVLSRTVTSAIRRLAFGAIDEVSLDHDIACRLVTGQEHSSDETFEAVAWYLAAMSIKPQIRIHTSNVEAGRRMAAILGIEYNNEIYDPARYVTP